MPNDRYSRYRQYVQRIEPALKQPHVRAYTMAILSLLTLSFFGAFAIRPSVKQIFELNRKISDRQLVNQKLDEKIKQLQLAEKEYEKIQAEFPVLIAALPPDPNFPPFLKELEKAASNSSVTLQSLKFQEIDLLTADATRPAAIVKNVSPGSLMFNLDATGSYQDLVVFLKKLDGNNRLIGINRFNLANEEQGTTSAALRVSFQAKTYFLLRKPEVEQTINER
ncbi:MAG: type 4a pilus biogenesis protein PilO [bacterium]|nr:type 4a pilus biogenesis protein PilO [bacterium]